MHFKREKELFKQLETVKNKLKNELTQKQSIKPLAERIVELKVLNATLRAQNACYEEFEDGGTAALASKIAVLARENANLKVQASICSDSDVVKV